MNSQNRFNEEWWDKYPMTYEDWSLSEETRSSIHIDKFKKIKIKKNRVRDHIWYISNIHKFKKDYPNWKQKYNTKRIIEELVEGYN